MSDDERLREAERYIQRAIDSDTANNYGHIMVALQEADWLVARVRELEAEHADNLAERLALLRAVAEVTANARSELNRALNAAKASDE